ncbi:MAG TPA: pyridoxal phosphate-dependent aminotransferase family protein [bacterium]|nr:pyridoxal phosphate-dependent aminotransferase family protein [bacterium]HQG44169.1 pyridoxal phosphate-dependent aminotransferase family protein [bacterium]HQI48964.1 pyridoxal phosphate-dependent aminotransferase family protein [bacterium]HQJ64598.1 pyridoxal phosphate-dependent aminotransferase family protein [bacterium]
MADLFDKCKSATVSARAREAMEQGWYPYFKAIDSGADTEVMIKGHRLIMIGSNNYLGLTQDPRVKKAAMNAIEQFGSGCTGSRFLNGTLALHEELESRLADFMKKEAVLIFSTGFTTNQGVISALVGRRDLVVGDSENHASIVDGTRLSFGRALKYRHQDMADLDRVLSNNKKDHGVLIVSDGVFSMGGDIVKLPEMVKVARKHGARIMIDDAHSLGVLGAHGRGTAEHFGLEHEVDLVMGTFSKSFASIGGFIAGPEEVVHFIKHTARALIFQASPPPAAVATVIAALDILIKEPERRERLWRNVKKMREGYHQLGFNTGVSETPVIPLLIGDDEKTFNFWKALYEAGIFSNPVISPAVPPGHSLIRTSYMATHTDEELDKVLEICGKMGKKLGII